MLPIWTLCDSTCKASCQIDHLHNPIMGYKNMYGRQAYFIQPMLLYYLTLSTLCVVYTM